MTKEEKKVTIEDLKDALGEIKNLYLADIAGLDALKLLIYDKLVLMKILNYWL